MIRILFALQNMNSKSQSAVEFITTYSWALVVMAIMISAIAYFGVLKPQRIFPERCIFNLAFGCQTQSIKSDGTVRLRLKNGVGHLVNVIQANLADEAGKSFGCALSEAPTSWRIDEIRELKWTGCDLASVGFSEGEKAKVLINMTYYNPQIGLLYQKIAQGEFISDVLSAEGGGVQTLSCSISAICNSPDLAVFKISGLQDAHAEIPSQTNYNNKVCCSSSSDTLGNSCVGGVVVLKLSSDTDAHVEKNTQTNYPISVCLSSSPGAVTCLYRQNSCNSDETCLASMSGDTDAHVANCGGNSYSTKICCKI